MEMEFMAEFTEGMSRDRARQIIKGKRTKRQRPCSPFGMSTTSGSSDGDCLIDNSTIDQSSEMSTKEDEDMANCLIMLAQSVSPMKEEKSDQIRQKTERLSSRRFTEMNATTGKSGLYAYECKTCNRTFPSFQALGGHRASHKKPKVNVEEKKASLVNIPPPMMETVEQYHDNHKAIAEEDEENKAGIIIITNNVQKSPSRTSSGSVQTGITNHNTKGKVHECSICGSEFLSGQALGGHMRKHRPIPPSSNRTVISVTATDDNTDDQIIEKSSPAGSSSMLSLDLNFPPPEVVEDHQSKFQFTAGSSQHLLFSGPAFVDCHY